MTAATRYVDGRKYVYQLQGWVEIVPSDDTPPRHSADDYRAIAERLKDLGYRGWITG